MESRGELERSLGEVVRQRRKELGLSQERLAEAADIHRNHVGLVERGQISPSLAAISAIARAIGLTASELVAQAEQGMKRRR